jgi:hypothetical protein
MNEKKRREKDDDDERRIAEASERVEKRLMS